MEDQLLKLALGEPVDTKAGHVEKASGVCFFSLPEGSVKSIDEKITETLQWDGIVDFNLKLKVGDKVNKITSSLNRYGQFIVKAETRQEVDALIEKYEKEVCSMIRISE